MIDLVLYHPVDHACLLVMIQAEPWSSAEHDVPMVLEKVNAYLAYVSGGQLLREHPDAEGATVAFQLNYFQEPPPWVDDLVGPLGEELVSTFGIALNMHEIVIDWREE